MKILFVTSLAIEYSTSSNLRNKALIYGLIKNGHDVTVLSEMPNENYSLFDQNNEFNKTVRRMYINKSVININRKKKNIFNVMKNRVGGILQKISVYDLKLRYINNILSLNLESHYDVIISSSDPKSSHKIVEALLEKKMTESDKWIQYWGDPFYLDINKNSLLPNIFIKREEKRILSKADKIIYVSPLTLKVNQEIFEDSSSKMFFLPVPHIHLNNKKEVGNIDKYEVGYFGSYNLKDRNLENFLEAMQDLKSKSIVCGDSNLNIEKYKNSNIYFLNRVSHFDSQELEKQTKVLICLCNRNGTQIPGKIFHYAATDKPILIILDGEMKQEIEDFLKVYDRFYFCNNTKLEIKQSISEILKSEHRFNGCKEMESTEVAKFFLNI